MNIKGTDKPSSLPNDASNPNLSISSCSHPGVDVILNKESNRETPSVVTFSAKQRMMGTSAGKFLELE